MDLERDVRDLLRERVEGISAPADRVGVFRRARRRRLVNGLLAGVTACAIALGAVSGAGSVFSVSEGADLAGTPDIAELLLDAPGARHTVLESGVHGGRLWALVHYRDGGESCVGYFEEGLGSSSCSVESAIGPINVDFSPDERTGSVTLWGTAKPAIGSITAHVSRNKVETVTPVNLIEPPEQTGLGRNVFVAYVERAEEVDLVLNDRNGRIHSTHHFGPSIVEDPLAGCVSENNDVFTHIPSRKELRNMSAAEREQFRFEAPLPETVVESRDATGSASILDGIRSALEVFTTNSCSVSMSGTESMMAEPTEVLEAEERRRASSKKHSKRRD